MNFHVFTIACALFFGATFARAENYDIFCNQGDCFKNGWVMKGVDYQLDATCKQNDCGRYGWTSTDTNGDYFDVNCTNDSCFENGWTSRNRIDGWDLFDRVDCKSGGCLKQGWKAENDYDILGGEVTCRDGDCSKYGGSARWRGRTANTYCWDQDCYHRGWTLVVQ